MNSRDLWKIEITGKQPLPDDVAAYPPGIATITWRVYEEPSYPDWRAFVFIIRWLGTGRRAFDFGRYSLIVELWWIR